MHTFDHGKLVRRQPRELKKFRRFILSVQRGELSELAIMHENDGSCCEEESWTATMTALSGAMMPGKKVLIVQ